jgi:putative ABC transport system substrate-binding protein
MLRRNFITLLGGAIAAAPSLLLPHPVHAQQAGRLRRIGVLLAIAENDPEAQSRLAALRQGLAELGWTEGRNIHIDYRFGAGDLDRIRTQAAELVRLAPDLILANGTPVMAALRPVTTAIPIVFVVVNDPVGQGFISNLARPGGNITGFTLNEFAMLGKWLGLLKELAPAIERTALMFNPQTAPYYDAYLREFEALPRSLKVELRAAPVRDEGEIDATVAAVARGKAGGLIVPTDTFNVIHREAIIRASQRHRVPAIHGYRQFAAEGALIAYGADTADIFRRSASYIDRILKGEKPADLPAQSPVKFEMAINVKTAKALGLEVPPVLLATADEVIE